MAVIHKSFSRWAGVLVAGLLVLTASPAFASDAMQGGPGLALMTRLQQAAHGLDYEGIYIYQQGAVMLASRIIHVTDSQGERQRVEVLDGRKRREILRHNDEVQSLFPEMQIVLVEHRQTEHFPALFIGAPEQLETSYSFRVEEELGRVAGRPCQIAHVVPRDALRWSFRLCVDQESGLLLKAQTVDSQGVVLEQVAFSEVQIGDDLVDSTQLEPRHDTRDWKRMRPGEPADLAAAGWHIMPPHGFQLVSQQRRALKHHQQVHQMVLSDGLAAISVFIESYEPGRTESPPAVQYGATNIFSRQEGDFWLTVLGEVPADTVRQVAETITYKGRAH